MRSAIVHASWKFNSTLWSTKKSQPLMICTLVQSSFTLAYKKERDELRDRSHLLHTKFSKDKERKREKHNTVLEGVVEKWVTKKEGSSRTFLARLVGNRRMRILFFSLDLFISFSYSLYLNNEFNSLCIFAISYELILLGLGD